MVKIDKICDDDNDDDATVLNRYTIQIFMYLSACTIELLRCWVNRDL